MMGDLERRRSASGRRYPPRFNGSQRQWDSLPGRAALNHNRKNDNWNYHSRARDGVRTESWDFNGSWRNVDSYREKTINWGSNRFNLYQGPFTKGTRVSFAIESKRYEIQVNENLIISKSKKGKQFSITIPDATAKWICESLSKKGWNISRYEGCISSKISWEYNRYGYFVRISAGSGKELAHICIPVGRQSAGLNLLSKALSAAINLKGSNDALNGVSNGLLLIKDPMEMEAFEINKNGVKDLEQGKLSISSALMDIDIALAEEDSNEKEDAPAENAIAEVNEESRDEELKALRLFQPTFQAYFDAIFKETEIQIKEALARNGLLEYLKSGVFKDESGIALRVTWETIKSMEQTGGLPGIGLPPTKVLGGFNYSPREKLGAVYILGLTILPIGFLLILCLLLLGVHYTLEILVNGRGW